MKKLKLAAILAVVMASPALAHPGHGDTSGFIAGIAHPVFGSDHLLAMLAVGLWSGFVMPNRVWAGAAAFLSAMGLGAAMSWSGIAIPGVEGWILASVVAFGVLTAVSRPGQPRAMTLASLGTIALFAMCHGHAHATEAQGNALGYLAGFLIATAGLHLAGIAMARAVANGAAARLIQGAAGAAIAVAGVAMMTAG